MVRHTQKQGLVLMASFSQSDLTALRAAYASGTLEVRFADGRSVKYPSGADLLRRIQVVEGELAASSGSPRPMARATTFNRG